jgi:hypothetical protein
MMNHNGGAGPGRWEPAAPSTDAREAHRGGAEAPTRLPRCRTCERLSQCASRRSLTPETMPAPYPKL